MRIPILIVAILFGALPSLVAQKQITTLILVRHAEKANDGTNDPDLTPEGVSRARHLAEILKKTSVDAVYSTDFKRTRNTVAPLAAAKNLEVKIYAPYKAAEIEKILREYGGGTVVICGHSNNIPWTANLLTGKASYQDFADSDYGNLLLVAVEEKGKIATVTWLTY